MGNREDWFVSKKLDILIGVVLFSILDMTGEFKQTALYLALIAFLLFVPMLYLIRRNTSKRLKKISFMTGFVLATCLVVGEGVKEGAVAPVPFLFRLLALSVVLAVFCGFAFWQVGEYLKQTGAKETRLDQYLVKRRTYVGLGLVLFLSWLPSFIAAFPGVFSYDAPHQVWQFVTGNVGNNQPIISSMILYGIIGGVHKVAGSYEAGVAVYLLLQMMFASATLGYMLSVIYKYTKNSLVVVVSTLFLVFNPANQLFVVNAAKDVIYAFFTVWLLVFIFESLLSPKEFYRSKWKTAGFVFFGLLFLFYRNNSIYVLLLSAPFLLVSARQKWKKMLLLLVLCLLPYFLITGPVYKKLGVGAGNPKVEMLSIPAQQVVRTYVTKGIKLDKEEMKWFFRYFQPKTPKEYQTIYRRNDSDTVRLQMNGAELDKGGMLPFLVGYVKLGAKHPLLYTKAALDNTLGYWYPYAGFTGVGSSRYIEYENSSYDAGIKTKRYALLPKVAAFYRKIGADYKIIGEHKLLMLLYSPATVFLSLVLIIGQFIYQKKYRLIWQMIFVLLLFLTVFVGPLVLMRYVYPIYLALPFLFALGFYKEIVL